MTSQEFKRWLQKQGCTFDLPMHGKQKELGTGLVNAIEKHLGLK